MHRSFDPVSLRLFIAVCEERNIARAAAREAIVASAVSKRIAAIEQAIGAALLIRGRRGIAPTPAGEALLRQAREVLGAMERMHAELDEFSAGVQGSVRVMASVSALAERLPDDIATFLRRHRSVRVSLDESVSSAIVRNVREGAADVGVLWDLADLAGLQIEPYRTDHLCVVVPQAHPFARRKRLRFEETLGEATIGVAPGGLMETLLRRQAALAGKTQIPRIQVSSLDAACRIVAAGLGLAVLPREAAAPHVSRAGPPQATDCAPIGGSERSERGGRHPSRAGPPQATDCAPIGGSERSERGGAFSPEDTGLIMVPLAEAWAERRFVVCSRPDPVLPAAVRLLVAHLKEQAKVRP